MLGGHGACEYEGTESNSRVITYGVIAGAVRWVTLSKSNGKFSIVKEIRKREASTHIS